MRQTVVFIMLALALCACREQPGYPEAPTSGDAVRLDTAALKEGEPLFLSYLHNGKRINFFVLKIKGGVQSYFDACARCAPKKLGYGFSDGGLLCRACGMRYPVDGLGGIGSCYPVKLQGRVSAGGNYIIEREKVVAGKKYF